jgi:hypothetical protein
MASRTTSEQDARWSWTFPWVLLGIWTAAEPSSDVMKAVVSRSALREKSVRAHDEEVQRYGIHRRRLASTRPPSAHRGYYRKHRPCSRITHEHWALREFLAYSEAGSAVTVNRLASATGLWAKWYHECKPYQATAYQEARCSCWRSLVLCKTLGWQVGRFRLRHRVLTSSSVNGPQGSDCGTHTKEGGPTWPPRITCRS